MLFQNNFSPTSLQQGFGYNTDHDRPQIVILESFHYRFYSCYKTDWIDCAEIGLGPAEIGLGPAEIGLGPAEIGLGPAESGLGPSKFGLSPTEIGLGPDKIILKPSIDFIHLHFVVTWSPLRGKQHLILYK